MYKLFKSITTGEVKVVNKYDGDMVHSIPFDPDNTDYQQYLKWVAEGNEPLPADEGVA